MAKRRYVGTCDTCSGGVSRRPHLVGDSWRCYTCGAKCVSGEWSGLPKLYDEKEETEETLDGVPLPFGPYTIGE